MAGITIDKQTAERLFDLYNNVAAADAHYQRCQSDNFRMHVRAVYQNKGVEDAFAELKDKIYAEQSAKAVESAPKARRSVLTDR